VIASTIDYAGRQLDMELLQHVATPVNQRVYPAVDHWKDGSGPSIVTGMQKVVQRYAKLLLTDIGSVKFDESLGGELLTDIRKGKIQSNSYLEFVFNVASHNAVQKMMYDDNNTDVYGDSPDDEKITEARLVDYELRPETATIYVHVEIETRAGEMFTYVIPVRMGISR